MTSDDDPGAADRLFFALLLEGNADALAALLADDFLIVDVMSGALTPKGPLLDGIRGGQLRFTAIEPAETLVRRYGGAAVVTGRTQMQGTFGGQPFVARSRYTHVYIENEGHWRMVSAQGTPIAM